jgi:hypothetical protein
MDFWNLFRKKTPEERALEELTNKFKTGQLNPDDDANRSERIIRDCGVDLSSKLKLISGVKIRRRDELVGKAEMEVQDWEEEGDFRPIIFLKNPTPKEEVNRLTDDVKYFESHLEDDVKAPYALAHARSELAFWRMTLNKLPKKNFGAPLNDGKMALLLSRLTNGYLSGWEEVCAIADIEKHLIKQGENRTWGSKLKISGTSKIFHHKAFPLSNFPRELIPESIQEKIRFLKEQKIVRQINIFSDNEKNEMILLISLFWLIPSEAVGFTEVYFNRLVTRWGVGLSSMPEIGVD